MGNNKISGGRSVGGQKPAPPFVDDMLALFGSVENAQTYTDGLLAFFDTGAEAQAVLDASVNTGSPAFAILRLIRDSLPNTSVEAFDIIAETNLITSEAGFVNELQTGFAFTVV